MPEDGICKGIDPSTLNIPRVYQMTDSTGEMRGVGRAVSMGTPGLRGAGAKLTAQHS